MTAQTRELILRTLQIVLGAIILLSPAAINRSPFVFYDTSHYLQFGRSILAQIPLIGPASPSGVTAAETSSSGAAAGAETAKEKDEHASLSYAGGRSPYYSVFVFAGSTSASGSSRSCRRSSPRGCCGLRCGCSRRRPIAMPNPIFCWWPVSRS